MSLTSQQDVHAYAREPHTGNFIVLPNSTVRKNVASEFPDNYPDLMALREELIDEGIIKEDGEQLKFQKEYSFDSRIAAKRVILGHQGSGRGTRWDPLVE